MSNLISREALLKAIHEHITLNRDTVAVVSPLLSAITSLPPITPQVVCNISGGLLQGASADYPVDVYALDFDVCDEDPSELIMVDGSEARLGQAGALVEPDFVRHVVTTPTLDVAVECQNCDWSGEIDDLKPIQDLHQRVEPGEKIPTGECPECGALAHLLWEQD